MEDNMANPSSSWAPRPLPRWGQDQALSGPLVGAVADPVWPQPDAEKEGGPCVMTEEKKLDMDIKPSQWGEVQPRDPDLWEEVKGCELYRAVQVAPCRAGGLYHRTVAVRVLRGDMVLGELPQGEKQFSDPKLPQQGGASVSSQENQARSPAPSEEVPSAGAQSPVPGLHSSSCLASPSPSPLGNQTPSEQQEQAEGESLLAEKGSEEGTPAGHDQDWEYHIHTELSQQCEGEVPELSDGDTSIWDSSSEDLHVSMEEDDGDNIGDDLTYVTCDSQMSITSFISSFGATPVSQEEDDLDNLSIYDWDELNILEWHEEGSRAQSLAALEEDKLCMPVPQEAGVEDQEPEPLHASGPSAPQAPQQTTRLL
ncbi:hypothetical protein TURU_157358 [Turdus rufiventris]|nr:hypothetical protein TURU_157358 [Turdus rufiventris]